MKLIDFLMYHPSNRAILQFCPNCSILLHRPSTKNAGTWRDLSFWPRTKILVFFEFLGLVLNVLKCVLRSENFSLFWGTLVRVCFTAVLLDRYKHVYHYLFWMLEKTYCKCPMEMSRSIEKMQSCLHNISIVVLTGFA